MGTISIIILIGVITIFVAGNHCNVGVSKGFPISNSHLLGLVLKKKRFNKTDGNQNIGMTTDRS